MIHNVLIFSNQDAYHAQEVINNALNKYQDEETEVNYELMIETSAGIGTISETRYTVLIEVSDRDIA